ncbi:MAG: ABC transporter permease [Lachnospiraceae bacterium]|nr:ABC transporter permease [Lachnospiraceae bacterium]
MKRYIAKRILWMIPIVLGVTVLVFTIMYFVPGDVAQIILGTNATAEELATQREIMGLNDPYYVQLFRYMENVFLHFDMGESYITGLPVVEQLMARLPKTLLLAVMCMLISVLVGIPLGITAAIHQNSWIDRTCMILSLVGVSMPSFWLAMLLVVLFCVQLRILPASGDSSFIHFILPTIAGSFGGIATQARQTRSSMLEVIRSDYIVTARAKGVPERSVIYKHALPNALIPIITVIGTSFGHMLGGSMIIETIFSINGVGTYIITAVNQRDFPVVQGGVIFLAIAFSLCILIVDAIYAFVDPRIKAMFTSKKGGK